MSRYMAIDPHQHRSAGWLPYPDYGFAAADALVPVVADEIPQIMVHMPLAFHAQQGGHALVCVQSLTGNLNLCVHPDGRWLAGYVPAYYRGYPFRLLPEPEGKRLLLCMDAESGLWLDDASDTGQRFFTEDGELTERFTRLKAFLEKLEEGRRRTHRAIAVLEKHELIVPWRLKTQSDSGETQAVEGISCIDEGALNALAPEALAEVRQEGGLSLAYAQLLSQHRISSLSRLYQLRHQLDPQTPDIDGFFEGDEELSFDFDS
ncbi:SapC family protein [Halomonas sabkhae]|uniref:SapC family protein n=1 Tax=Halomonas sabkhae TaxID=626223 RepID=UPI0025B5D4B3|nr:SapC family protein [Halomonas sabkhae]MDN3524168.1 SapC family protein [Halomonas sabkhae]